MFRLARAPFASMACLCSVPHLGMSISEQAHALFRDHFGDADEAIISVPGRVNLIGEHIDYHNLPVLPMAIQRHIAIAFRSRTDLLVRVHSSNYGAREFALTPSLHPSPLRDWMNYLRAASQAAQSRWKINRGIDAAITSDLPAAAGLSSSSALLAGFTIALLRANEICPALDELMDILPEAEHFVGTRGGGMDHAAVLAAHGGCALLIKFAPFEISHIPVPPGWSFLVAHSLTLAEKSGAIRAEYNARRIAAIQALESLGLPSFRAALDGGSSLSATKALPEMQQLAFLHVTSEAVRVQQAVAAMRESNLTAFGELLNASHASLRDQLRISSPALDALVEAALEAGAQGARLTGAGFGGCVIILCTAADRDIIQERLIRNFYSKRSDFDPANHLFEAQPSAGALVD